MFLFLSGFMFSMFTSSELRVSFCNRMGVKGLTTFVNQHDHQFFKSYQLHSTELVIDGYGIMSQLYFNLTIDSGNHGGEFQKFYTHCANFCKNLHNCEIRPYVLFDGAYHMDGKKCETREERLQQKIDNVRSINNGRHAFIMPTMAIEVFKKVLRDFRFPFGFCDFEADRDIAVVANMFGCPVLGQDSDFFIMDIYYGYIPFDEFIWSNPVTCGSQNLIKCKRYQMKNFCSYFQVEPCLMPLFASVCGNDYLKPLLLDKFFSATKQREHDGRPHPQKKDDKRFCEVLHHFTYYQTYQECLEEIVKHVPRSDREKTEWDLGASCDMYKVVKESPMVKFFEGEDTDLSTNLLVRDHSIPASFARLLRKGEVPNICLVINLNLMYFFGAQVEKISENRSSDCSQDLLRVLAGIMLVDAAKESQSKGEALTIDIYDRDKVHVKRFQVEPLCEIPLFGTVPSFKRISSTSKDQYRLLLLACLEANDMTLPKKIPEQFHLVLVVTVYWLHHAQQEVPHNLLVALVLGWIQGVAWCQWNSLAERLIPFYPLQDYDTVFNKFCDLATQPLQNSLNLDVSHILAQWVACICTAEDINALLMQVFPRADMTVFFNGLLIHNLYHALPILRKNHEKWIDDFLPRLSPGRELFEDLKRFLLLNYKVEKRKEYQKWETVACSSKRGQRGRGGYNRNPRGGNT